MRRFCGLLVAVVWVCVISGACALSPGNSLLPLTLFITNPITTVNVGDAAITLKVELRFDTTNKGLTWTLTNNGMNCSPSCGTLMPAPSPSLSAVYQPPAKGTPITQAVITITSVAQPAIQASDTFSIQSPPPPAGISVAITNAFTTQNVDGPIATVGASVKADTTNSGVSWNLAVSGSSCSPGCGTLTPVGTPSFAATYQPPSATPSGGNATPTIQATSVADPTKSASFSFTIGPSAVASLTGTYAILLRGFDADGLPFALAGSFTADGTGKITAGEFDTNDDGGIGMIPAPATGTYSVDTSFNGAPRGQIVITSFTFPGSSVNPAFRFSLAADGSEGTIVEFDGSGAHAGGRMLLQSSTVPPGAANCTAPAGTFVYGLDSDAPVGDRLVEVGQFQVNAAGAVTGGLADASKAFGATPVFSAAAITAGTATPADAAGRGTLSLTVGGNSTSYAYYIVNPCQMNLLQIDQGLVLGDVQAGTAFAQQPLNANSINLTSVVQMTGLDSPHGTNNLVPDVMIGLMTISAGNTVTLLFDTNDNGSIGVSEQEAGSVVNFDPSTGRATLSTPGASMEGFVDSAVVYLYSSGQGFLIDTDFSGGNGIANHGFSGTIVPQATGPFDTSTLSGNLIGFSGNSSVPGIPDVSGVTNADGAQGTYTGIADFTSPVASTGEQADVPINGLFSVTDTTNGHGQGVIHTISQNQSVTFSLSFYIIGPNQIVAIGTQANVGSGVTFFDPQ